MVEISNIDATIDLILREARARKAGDLITRIYRVHREVSERINEVMEKTAEEVSRKKKEQKHADWAKGM